MDIIFNRQVAEELSQKYLVLELEPHLVGEDILETFCVLAPEKVVNEVAMLDHWKKLHDEFVQANKNTMTYAMYGLSLTGVVLLVLVLTKKKKSK